MHCCKHLRSGHLKVSGKKQKIVRTEKRKKIEFLKVEMNLNIWYGRWMEKRNYCNRRALRELKRGIVNERSIVTKLQNEWSHCGSIEKISSLSAVGANDIWLMLPVANNQSLEEIGKFGSQNLSLDPDWHSVCKEILSKIQITTLLVISRPDTLSLFPVRGRACSQGAITSHGVPKADSCHQSVTPVCESSHTVRHRQGDKSSTENSCSESST